MYETIDTKMDDCDDRYVQVDDDEKLDAMHNIYIYMSTASLHITYPW